MAQGPPPSEAQSSGVADKPQGSIAAPPASSYYNFQLSTTPSAPTQASQPQAAYSYPSGSWPNPWTYPYTTGSPYPYQYAQYQHYQPTAYPSAYSQSQSQASPQEDQNQHEVKSKIPSPSPSPSPSPPPPVLPKDWDALFKRFFERIGFLQSLQGFENDMLVLNAEWEAKALPGAIIELVQGFSQDIDVALPKNDEPLTLKVAERPLEDRKLTYVHLANGKKPQTPSTVTKSISRFLAKNRARNDASNRAEFLYSLSEKRFQLTENGARSPPIDHVPSCARTDAKSIDRDLQMKYDIAKNEEGPLRKTVKVPPEFPSSSNLKRKREDRKGKGKARDVDDDDEWNSGRHRGVDERLKNLETHLAVRYVPSAPQSLLARLQFLESHLIQLEKDYPPWAALHFNQPNRGWPPPPRPTPIIVPSHLTRTDVPPSTSTHGVTDTLTAMSADPELTAAKGKVQGRKPKDTSLHRAVMEKLEVKKAKEDLMGSGSGTR